MHAAWTKFIRSLGAFRTARSGNVAITFALATLPIIGTVGFAVDYSHANSVKVAMQAALDSTALMLSRDAASLSSNDLKTKAKSYFDALFTRPEAKNITISASYTTSSGSQVLVTGSADVPTTFLGVIGYQNINVNGSATAAWGSTRLRVALVLDNTGSMADAGKMDALKTATKSLLTQLQNASSTSGDVYASIIPFSKDVNLGAGNWGSDYLYWDNAAKSDNKSWDANNGTCSAPGYTPRSACLLQSSCSVPGYTSQSTCTGAGTCSISGNNDQTSCTSAGTCSIAGPGHATQSTCTAGSCSIAGNTTQSSCASAGVCSNPGETNQSSCTGNKACSLLQYTTKSHCTNAGGTWAKGTWTTGSGVWTAGGTWTAGTWTPGVWSAATWTPNDHSTWKGCVVDRGNSVAPDTVGNYDTNATAPSTTITSTLYAAEQYSACPQAVLGLSYNWSTMTTLVSNMSPNGNTNQGIGLQLGWLSLVGGGPFTAPPMDSNYNYQQVIILLTDGLNTQDRWYTSQSSIDARQQLTCNNIKAAGITLYTIQVNTGGDPTSSLLKNCASGSDKFYLLTTAGAISTTFNTIGTNLTKLRVAK